ncbi:MAG TPA: hypothetical protein VIM02_05480 [Rhizomicrobium sp.]|jgi:ElaB/YqjD/DUF883 family membrane-anchored ribosome-binding protein
MSLTDQYERKAETHRAHISELLDELRYRATPGEIMDQFLGWEDGREIARNFGRQVRDNPLPLALIGAGVAWLMLSDGVRQPARVPLHDGLDDYEGFHGYESAANGLGRRAKRTMRKASDSVRSVKDSASELSQRAKDTAADLGEGAQSALDSARETASGVADNVQAGYGKAKQAVSEAADSVADTASDAWEKSTDLAQRTADTVTQTASNLNRLAHEQPLLVAGIGLAVGMAIGAVVPMSEAEHRLMGEPSDKLKDSASDLASEGYEKAKAVAEDALEAAAGAVSASADADDGSNGSTASDSFNSSNAGNSGAEGSNPS